MLKWIALSALLFLSPGCVSVYPQARPVAAKAVYITDYGIHSSLIIPNGDGRYVEYAYGDWNYAALNHDWPNDAMGALLVSFKSTLGRRFIETSPSDPVPHPVHRAPKRMQVIYSSGADVEKVRKILDDRYRNDATKVVHNPENDMDFVPDSEHYSFWNNCNDLTARCLRQMGCDVRGIVGFSKFQVVQVKQEFIDEPHVAEASVSMPTARAN
jgi:hypothetical protein